MFLSDVTPGLLTLTEPTTTNHVSKPMAIILASTTSMEVLNMRGALISPSYTFAQNTIVFGQSPYTVTTLDFFIDVDASGGNTIINLPTAVGIQGRVYNIKKIDSSSNTVAVQPFGAQTIDGQTSISMSAQYTAISIHSNNSNWWIF